MDIFGTQVPVHTRAEIYFTPKVWGSFALALSLGAPVAQRIVDRVMIAPEVRRLGGQNSVRLFLQHELWIQVAAIGEVTAAL